MHTYNVTITTNHRCPRIVLEAARNRDSRLMDSAMRQVCESDWWTVASLTDGAIFFNYETNEVLLAEDDLNVNNAVLNDTANILAKTVFDGTKPLHDVIIGLLDSVAYEI